MTTGLRAAAKGLAIVCFLTLLACTYLQRADAMALGRIRVSADDTRAREDMARFVESYDDRVKEYEQGLEHYQKMQDLYKSDNSAYMEAVRATGGVPPAPQRPRKPQAPEVTKKLAEINTEFRAARHEYFVLSGRVIVVSMFAALGLVGSMLALLVSESGSARWIYLAILGMAFVFMIGPAFHSILAGVVGSMTAPPYEPYGYAY